MTELNKYSKTVTQDPTQPAAQAMLYAIGMNDNDMKKAQVGVVSTGYQGNPCNMHLNGLADQIKKGIDENGLMGLIFHTIGVSDGITNGTEGMKYSLPSREIIADSIETVVAARICRVGVLRQACVTRNELPLILSTLPDTLASTPSPAAMAAAALAIQAASRSTPELS